MVEPLVSFHLDLQFQDVNDNATSFRRLLPERDGANAARKWRMKGLCEKHVIIDLDHAAVRTVLLRSDSPETRFELQQLHLPAQLDEAIRIVICGILADSLPCECIDLHSWIGSLKTRRGKIS